MKIWSWRHAVAQAKLEPMTKLVLYTLANYMNETGGGCYPSLDTLQAESGMARATVVKHLDLAEAAGFITRRKHGYAGQKWARNEYRATYPKGTELADNGTLELSAEKGSSAGEPPLPEGSSTDTIKAVQQVNSNSPGNSPVSDSIESADGKPPAPDFKKMVFDQCIPLIGGNEGSARSLIGRWLRDYGEAAVLAAVMAAQKESAVEPRSFIEKVLKGGKNGTHRTGYPAGHRPSKSERAKEALRQSAADLGFGAPPGSGR